MVTERRARVTKADRDRAFRFWAAIEAAFRALPPDRVRTEVFGSARGARIVTYWVYQPWKNSELEMHAHLNEKERIVTCLVCPAGAPVGVGPALQFPCERCMRDDVGGTVVLVHPGIRAHRADLALPSPVMPHEVVDLFAVLNPRGEWPLRLGSTSDTPTLLDKLFEYAYATEQARRCLEHQTAARDDSRAPFTS